MNRCRLKTNIFVISRQKEYMTPTLIIIILALYFGILIAISIVTSKGADVDTFFTGNRQNKWYLVAFGMIGTSLSGVTFISVPGTVIRDGMGYYQVVLGYILGYIVIAQVLMPLYYKMQVTSIYQYLEQRLGLVSYKTGASFFVHPSSFCKTSFSASYLDLNLSSQWQ